MQGSNGDTDIENNLMDTRRTGGSRGWDVWREEHGKTHITTTTKSFQSCPTLRDPIDGSLPGSPVPGILQARTLEWAAISCSNA